MALIQRIVPIMALFLSGCALVPGLRVSDPDPVESGNYQLIDITADVIGRLRTERADKRASTLEPIADYQQNFEYAVGPRDILTIVVWDHPELTNPTGEFSDPENSGRLVSADGTIFYPHAGVLHVAGKTVKQIRQDIAWELTRVIKNPQVDVRVAAYRSQRIQVSGEVKAPGLVTLDDTPKGVLEAVNERGGLTPDASRRELVITRAGKTHTVHLGDILSGVSTGANTALKAGDSIYVPHASRDQVFVLGEVEAQAPIAIQHTALTLTEALAKSGGLDRLSANDAGVLVFRRAAAGSTSSDVPTVFKLDISEPGGLLLAGEFELEPRDVVYVKATAFSQYNLVINQILPTVSTIFQVDRLTDGR